MLGWRCWWPFDNCEIPLVGQPRKTYPNKFHSYNPGLANLRICAGLYYGPHPTTLKRRRAARHQGTKTRHSYVDTGQARVARIVINAICIGLDAKVSALLRIECNAFVLTPEEAYVSRGFAELNQSRWRSPPGWSIHWAFSFVSASRMSPHGFGDIEAMC